MAATAGALHGAPHSADDTSWLGQWLPVRAYRAAPHRAMPATLVVERRHGPGSPPLAERSGRPTWLAKPAASRLDPERVDRIARLVHQIAAAAVETGAEGRAALPAFLQLAELVTGDETALAVARATVASATALLPDRVADLSARHLAAEALAWLEQELAVVGSDAGRQPEGGC
jgi:hypothetical protein